MSPFRLCRRLVSEQFPQMTVFFQRFTGPLIRSFNDPRVLEVGASVGKHTDLILSIDTVELVIVDPCLDKPLDLIHGGNERVTVHKALSLDGLREVDGDFDCIIIDGDHNWFTVINELRIIEERGLLRNCGVILFHDVCWPYARRDMYYQLETIPEEFRQPCRKSGVVRGKSELQQDGMNAEVFNAEHEGGSRNGVLTAIEDFMSECDLHRFFIHREQHGFGVLTKNVACSKTAFRRLQAKSRSETVKARCNAALQKIHRVSKRILTGRWRRTLKS
jgi:hypothetical protein